MRHTTPSLTVQAGRRWIRFVAERRSAANAVATGSSGLSRRGLAVVCAVALLGVLSLGSTSGPRAETQRKWTVAFSEPFTGPLADALARVREEAGVEVYADRRWASTRVFVAEGQYRVGDLVVALAAASLLVPRKIGDMIFLAAAAEVAGAAGPTELAQGDEARDRLIRAVGGSQTALNLPADVARVFPPEQFVGRRRVPFDSLSPQQKQVLQSKALVPLAGKDVEFLPCLMVSVDPHRNVVLPLTPADKRRGVLPGRADQGLHAIMW